MQSLVSLVFCLVNSVTSLLSLFGFILVYSVTRVVFLLFARSTSKWEGVEKAIKTHGELLSDYQYRSIERTRCSCRFSRSGKDH